MARLIQCEADGEGDIGMRAVASVVMNRVNTFEGEYGRYNTIPAVIFADRQFECVTSEIRNIYLMNPSDIHYSIAEWAINGGRLGGVADSLWFFNPFSATCPLAFPNNSGTYFIKIQNHCFYRPTFAYSKT